MVGYEVNQRQSITLNHMVFDSDVIKAPTRFI